MGVAARDVHRVRVRGRKDLVESSAAAMSVTQTGVFFTINDSGNEPVLFALDTTGVDRGAWRVRRAKNDDWEAASIGLCGSRAARGIGSQSWCVYIGDVGDNAEVRREGVIYRVAEPAARRERSSVDAVSAEALVYRYADGPHDVEAMYVRPDGAITLITKRPRLNRSSQLRPALVFTLPANAWGSDTTVVAVLTDSLPIVPGSAVLRTITDAALSPDNRYLAVRTYGQVYVFAADTATGRVIASIPPAICNIAGVEDEPGEGVTWIGATNRLLLTSEGRNASIQIVSCPLPRR
jgi:hypothetical protein